MAVKMTAKSKMKKEVSMDRTVKELHVAYRKLNEVFFKNELPTPAIVIQSQGNRNAFGWVSVEKVWTDLSGEIAQYELGIASEHLHNREGGYLDVIQTLLHEMNHIFALENNLKDVSRNYTYHNKVFKANCEAHGMTYPHDKPHPKIGFSQVIMTEATRSIVQNIGIDEEAFTIGRMEFNGEKEKKKTSWLWECDCGQKARTTKPEFNAICGDCETRFEFVK
jgi:hypothetical protein